jgi:hypothetical protein
LQALCGSLFLIIVCLFVFVFGIFCRGVCSSCCCSPSILSDLWTSLCGFSICSVSLRSTVVVPT